MLFGDGAGVEHTVAALCDLRALLLVADRFAARPTDAVAVPAPVMESIGDVVQHVPAENARAAVVLTRSRSIDAAVFPWSPPSPAATATT